MSGKIRLHQPTSDAHYAQENVLKYNKLNQIKYHFTKLDQTFDTSVTDFLSSRERSNILEHSMKNILHTYEQMMAGSQLATFASSIGGHHGLGEHHA